MALIFQDGFDHYDTAHLPEKWSSGGGNIVSGGLNGQGLQLGGGSSQTKNLPENASTLIVGCAAQISSLGTGQLIVFQDNGNNQCSVYGNSDGSLSVNDHNGNVLGSSSPGLLIGGVYQYVEAKITFASSGTADVHLNGVSVLSLTGINTSGGTGNAYANMVELRNPGSSTTFDNFYIFDGTGTVNNDFAGDVKMVLLGADGDGRVNQWSQVGGTSGENYTSINEIPPDDDTSYVYSSTPGQIDAYTVSSIGSPSAVLAVQITASARKDDSGTRVLALGFGNGTTESYDTGFSLGNNYTMYTMPMDINPLTGVAWEVSDFSTAQIAIQEIS